MSSFVIAGKADDPSYARAEYAAKQVQAIVPNVFFRLEMKHPDHWKEFINSICKLYDFSSYSDDFGGPLVWTLEGDLVGGSADFVHNVCIHRFGMKDPPAVTDPLFKQIASDNLKQVKLQLQREQSGPSLAERCDTANAKAKVSNLLSSMSFDKRQLIHQGGTFEVWTSDQLAERQDEVRGAYADGQAARLEPGLRVCKVGQEDSHIIVLHPMPLVEKQLVLVPLRQTADITFKQLAEEEAAKQAEDAVVAPELPEDEAAKVAKLEIHPHKFRTGPIRDEDLSHLDFVAAMDILLNVGGVATWTGLKGSSEYRHPVETYIQVLPFPLNSAGADSPLQYPLELYIERVLHEGKTKLPVFPFQHYLVPVSPEKPDLQDYAKAVTTAYEKAKAHFDGSSWAIAFTTSWLLIMPMQPPDVDSPHHEAWLKLPPPHPCSLCGLLISMKVPSGFPETAGVMGLSNGKLVSTRAEEEGIPEGSPEFDVAIRDVRICSQLL
eukprot:CAMPEP_0197634858 /NCGR_PEP_ID=MMETSP1338-20131121/10834_1 /TAXON_ID=43686 ORGANISM="Pelagodinium beii, Strain RCC1491" /NCGR_SAMPLE_ID=MMETSP1338 /ASSEMBLY_ACC=CAM_ASM_000754 /LENGTH=492 /DNA_ID=CAMNT_0043206805 /DNA_START=47 /DNA_END=1522 /DNA_ORIENTATION=-